MSVAQVAHQCLRFLPERWRHDFLRSRSRFSDEEVAGVRVKLVETAEEAVAAARILHDAYVERGIMPRHPSGVRATAHALLPTTHAFIALCGGKIIGTMSLVEDCAIGLPLEHIYTEEVAAMRREVNAVAEVGSLAIVPEFRRTGIACLLNLFMFRTARAIGTEKLVVAVHPNAEELYRACLLFERFGRERSYPGLTRSARAVGLALDVPSAEARFREAFRHRPKTTANPHYFYFESSRPELTLPRTWALRRHGDRAGIARELGRLRPDLLAELQDDVRLHLRLSVPRSQMPTEQRRPSFVSFHDMVPA